ncbi:hydroxyacyl-thioester dehydratase-like protein [Metarhizium robertsii ARSEF 23]|uniref:Hydroxyacyl-thioester dehydratase-like protein n=1 Tax=Metarhizium robertsii (strain ARSEF 23 / ATCC MYA-3075) TaxID=655844 RepID=E9ETQ4_METRA|nr:hydroxyacyl-thioester dehydratase-like protein [Metarhizium robertsii ARSEF 23]EFZ00807.2 hydroxyacyl-thioester dehydratase-like protein [Metarhizium robertsii ARSEF 23]
MRRVLPQKRPFSPSQPSPTSSSRITNDLQSRPPKLIPDYLNPMPSHLLSTTLSDLLHAPTPSSPAIQSPPEVLPQGHHLVYFPIQTAPSKLAPDGADLDHSPGPEFPRRMWAGGEVNFHKGWRESLLMDGRPWRCKEEIGDVRVKGDKGQEKVFVDVWRRAADAGVYEEYRGAAGFRSSASHDISPCGKLVGEACSNANALVPLLGADVQRALDSH